MDYYDLICYICMVTCYKYIYWGQYSCYNLHMKRQINKVIYHTYTPITVAALDRSNTGVIWVLIPLEALHCVVRGLAMDWSLSKESDQKCVISVILNWNRPHRLICKKLQEEHTYAIAIIMTIQSGCEFPIMYWFKNF